MTPARRRRNADVPTWMWAVPLGVVVSTIVALRVGVAIRRARRSQNAPIYLYWAEIMPTAFMEKFPGYVPHLQREDGTEHVTLTGRLTEAQALTDAQAEIERRGGVPREGKPV